MSISNVFMYIQKDYIYGTTTILPVSISLVDSLGNEFYANIIYNEKEINKSLDLENSIMISGDKFTVHMSGTIDCIGRSVLDWFSYITTVGYDTMRVQLISDMISYSDILLIDEIMEESKDIVIRKGIKYNSNIPNIIDINTILSEKFNISVEEAKNIDRINDIEYTEDACDIIYDNDCGVVYDGIISAKRIQVLYSHICSDDECEEIDDDNIITMLKRNLSKLFNR